MAPSVAHRHSLFSQINGRGEDEEEEEEEEDEEEQAFQTST